MFCELKIWAKSGTLLKCNVVMGVTVNTVVIRNLTSCRSVEERRHLLPPFCPEDGGAGLSETSETLRCITSNRTVAFKQVFGSECYVLDLHLEI